MSTQISREFPKEAVEARSVTRAAQQAEQAAMQVLAAAGLLEAGDGEVLWSVRGRHETTLVKDRTRPSRTFFVKICGQPLLRETLTLDGERRFYHAIEAGIVPPELKPFVPPLVREVDEGRGLVFVGYPDHVALRAAWKEGEIDLDVVRQLGRFLAVLHATPQPHQTHLPTATAPVTTHGHVTPEALANGPGTYAELLRLIQGAGEFNHNLRRLRASWSPQGLVHGDMRLDNVLVSGEPTPASTPLVVDWELAARGDQNWDCGALVGSLYFTWLERCHRREAETFDEETAADFQRAIRTLLETYAETRSTAVDLGLILAWAGYWLTQQVMVGLPLRRRLLRFDLSALHLAQQLLTEMDPCVGTDLGA